VPFAEWLAKLKKSASLGQEERNPAVKLIDWFEETYGTGRKGMDFQTGRARGDARVLREPPKMIEDGYVRRFLQVWMKKWEAV